MEFTPTPPKKTLMLFFFIPFFLFGPCLGLTGFLFPQSFVILKIWRNFLPKLANVVEFGLKKRFLAQKCFVTKNDIKICQEKHHCKLSSFTFFL